VDQAAESTKGWQNAIPPTLTQLQQMQSQINATTISADTLAGAMVDKLLNSMLSIANAELGVHQALTQMSDSLKANGRNFNENTAQGQANMQALLGDVAANQRLYDANIASGMSAKDAAAAYDRNTAALHDQLIKAGMTDAQVNKLIGTYGAVPDDVNTTIATYGLSNAINNLGSLLAYINKIDGSVYGFTIEEHHEIDYSEHRAGERQPGKRWGGIESYHFDRGGILAQAGIARAGPRPIVTMAEPGVIEEGWVPRNGDPARSLDILRTMAGWYGASVVTPGMVAGVLGPGAGGGAAAAGVRSASGGAPAGAVGYAPIVVQLGGTQMAAVHAALIPVAQQTKARTGTTGLA
jgi:hypothetical protein